LPADHHEFHAMSLQVFSDQKQLWLLGSVGHIRAEPACLGRSVPSGATARAAITPTYSGATTRPRRLGRTPHSTWSRTDRSGMVLAQRASSLRWTRPVPFQRPQSAVVQPYRDSKPPCRKAEE
jgi:hypothetical protein